MSMDPITTRAFCDRALPDCLAAVLRLYYRPYFIQTDLMSEAVPGTLSISGRQSESKEVCPAQKYVL
jgi:hypothetical protein